MCVFPLSCFNAIIAKRVSNGDIKKKKKKKRRVRQKKGGREKNQRMNIIEYTYPSISKIVVTLT